jgi:hypothetical protein
VAAAVAVTIMAGLTAELLKTVRVADKHLIPDKTDNQLHVAVTVELILVVVLVADNTEQTAALGLL